MKSKNQYKSWVISVCLLALLSGFPSGCSPDDDTSSSGGTPTFDSNLSKPSFAKFLSMTDFDGFTIMVRFKTGGDSENHLSATVYWKAYAKKPSTTPTKNELTNVESMRQYGTAVYHNTGSKKGMTESIVFEKSHAGYNGGTYIYYYVECRNSVGSGESPLSYEIVKR